MGFITKFKDTCQEKLENSTLNNLHIPSVRLFWLVSGSLLVDSGYSWREKHNPVYLVFPTIKSRKHTYSLEY